MGKCIDCKFYDKGYCYRYPPQDSDLTTIATDSWCGEFSQDDLNDVHLEIENPCLEARVKDLEEKINTHIYKPTQPEEAETPVEHGVLVACTHCNKSTLIKAEMRILCSHCGSGYPSLRPIKIQ